MTDRSDCCTYWIETLFLLSPSDDHDDDHSSSLSSCPDMCLAQSANVHGTGPVWRISQITSRARSSCASSCHLNRSGPVSVDADVQLEELGGHVHLPSHWDQCRCFTTARLSLGRAVDPDEPPPSPAPAPGCSSTISRKTNLQDVGRTFDVHLQSLTLRFPLEGLTLFFAATRSKRRL